MVLAKVEEHMHLPASGCDGLLAVVTLAEHTLLADAEG